MSKNNITWTHELRVTLYRMVSAILGHPSQVARGTRGKPVGMSKKRYIEVLDDIADAMGLGPNKGGALSNQIAWITCVPSKGCHQGHWNNRTKNLAAAGEAGYLAASVVPRNAPVLQVSTPTTTTTQPVQQPTSFWGNVWHNIKSWF